MNFYRNLKIRTKYFIPITITVLGFLIVVFYGAKTLNSNSNNFIEFIDKDQTLLLSLNNMYAQGLQSEQATRNVLLNPSDQMAKDNYNTANNDFAKQFELAKKAADGNSKTLDDLNVLEQIWHEVDALKKNVQNLAVAGSSEEGISLLTNAETPKWRAFKKNLLNLIAKKQQDIAQKKIDVQQAADNAFVKMISFSVFIALFGFVIIFFAAKAFVKPICLLETSAKKVASGDTNVSLDIKSNDEMGSLAKSFNIMVENIRNSLNEAKQKGTIAEAAAKEAEEAKNIANVQKEYLNVSVRKILVEMENFANGDLNTHLKVEKNDEIGRLYTGFNKAVENIRTMIVNVSESVLATAKAAGQISSSSEEMAAGVQEQSQQTMEVAGAVEEMTKTILETSKNSSSASEAAKNSGAIAKEGGKVVNETIEGMIRIADVVKKSAETVQALGNNSDQIGEIIQVIDDIADQTNLLALNAAIEAARAGEQGRGFAVVADEVRKLAERTTKATKEIASMIKQIQKDTEGAVISMKEGTAEVEKGKALADRAGQSLGQIINGAESVVDISIQVAAASEEQSTTAEQISKSIEAINNVTRESSEGIQQIAKAAEDLNKLTNNLESLISNFKIDKNSNLVTA